MLTCVGEGTGRCRRKLARFAVEGHDISFIWFDFICYRVVHFSTYNMWVPWIILLNKVFKKVKHYPDFVFICTEKHISGYSRSPFTQNPGVVRKRVLTKLHCAVTRPEVSRFRGGVQVWCHVDAPGAPSQDFVVSIWTSIWIYYGHLYYGTVHGFLILAHALEEHFILDWAIHRFIAILSIQHKYFMQVYL